MPCYLYISCKRKHAAKNGKLYTAGPERLVHFYVASQRKWTRLIGQTVVLTYWTVIYCSNRSPFFICILIMIQKNNQKKSNVEILKSKLKT